MKDKTKDYSKLFTELKCIGKGNFGTAHLVKNTEDHMLYVAKKIALDALSEKEMETAFQEATLLKNLDNPHIVSYKNSFCDNRVLIIVMEYCENGDLGTLIKKKKEAGKRFTEAEIMHWFVQICLGLNYIHSMRVMHRDLKASNIFLSANGCVKIGDFGISKVLQGTLEAAMTVVGTPYYMSPEVCQNKPYTLKSDIWSLGCLLYELCTLDHPFTADNLLSLVYKIVKEQYEALPEEYSQELQNLIVASLLKDDEARPTTSNILDMGFVEKYMKDFIQTKVTALKKTRPFDRQATATAHIQQASMPVKKVEAEETKKLTAKEKLMLRKEEEARKKFDEMTIAAKGAYQQMAE